MYDNDEVTTACSKLLQMFESGQMPAAVTRTVIATIEGDEKPSYKWSLGNQIIMLANGTEDARGFKQWQEVGRFVKKGAKSFKILAPLTKKIAEENEKGEKKEKYIVYGFREIPVFKYEDTDGKPLPASAEYTPATLPPLIKVAEKLGVKVEYGANNPNYYGYYSHGDKLIKLCSHDESVFFHELAHAAHSTFKLKRKAGQEADREIVAETAAAVLCQLYGYEGYIYNAYKYIKGYANADEPKQVIKSIMGVLGDIQKVLNIILGIQKDINQEAA